MQEQKGKTAEFSQGSFKRPAELLGFFNLLKFYQLLKGCIPEKQQEILSY